MKYLSSLYISFCMLCFVCISCSKNKEVDEGQIAAIAAKGYYDELLQGHYDTFVAGRYQPDSIPAGYREQLVTNAKMFIGQQNTEHQGIKSVDIVSAEADTLHKTANVFLVMKFGDKNSEQIVVPMVKSNNAWYMR